MDPCFYFSLFNEKCSILGVFYNFVTGNKFFFSGSVDPCSESDPSYPWIRAINFGLDLWIRGLKMGLGSVWIRALKNTETNLLHQHYHLWKIVLHKKKGYETRVALCLPNKNLNLCTILTKSFRETGCAVFQAIWRFHHSVCLLANGQQDAKQMNFS